MLDEIIVLKHQTSWLWGNILLRNLLLFFITCFLLSFVFWFVLSAFLVFALRFGHSYRLSCIRFVLVFFFIRLIGKNAKSTEMLKFKLLEYLSSQVLIHFLSWFGLRVLVVVVVIVDLIRLFVAVKDVVLGTVHLLNCLLIRIVIAATLIHPLFLLDFLVLELVKALRAKDCIALVALDNIALRYLLANFTL